MVPSTREAAVAAVVRLPVTSKCSPEQNKQFNEITLVTSVSANVVSNCFNKNEVGPASEATTAPSLMSCKQKK